MFAKFMAIDSGSMGTFISPWGANNLMFVKPNRIDNIFLSAEVN